MRNLRSEDEIIAHWKDDIYKPKVSICCITYNHECYIEDALEGFLNQITDFPYEILIHDDASSDKTAEIIKRYHAKYPLIIKPIYQIKNKFSEGFKITSNFLFPAAIGTYIALCEGDDFWCDKDKLTKQVTLLDKSNSKICFTSAYSLDRGLNRKLISKYSKSINIFTLYDVAINGGGFMPTASIMIDRSIVENLPCWISNAPVLDYYLQVYSSSFSGAIYLPDSTCVYRTNSIGSWTSSRKSKPLAHILKEYDSHFNAVLNFNVLGLSEEQITFILSEFALSAAYELFKYGFAAQGAMYIEKSKKLRPYGSIKQQIFYYFRRFPRLLKFLIS